MWGCVCFLPQPDLAGGSHLRSAGPLHFTEMDQPSRGCLSSLCCRHGIFTTHLPFPMASSTQPLVHQDTVHTTWITQHTVFPQPLLHLLQCSWSPDSLCSHPQVDLSTYIPYCPAPSLKVAWPHLLRLGSCSICWLCWSLPGDSFPLPCLSWNPF